MSMNDTLSTALSNILNAGKVGKQSCIVKPISKIIKVVFEIMKNSNFLGNIEYTENIKGGSAKVHLLGNINKCGSIKPRYNIKKTDYEKFEKRYLPAKDFGFLIVSTSKGVMTHLEAKEKKLGGRLLAYFY
ncbi:30S ribosomal protein S8 [Candidatus Woesearchaeota archaeon]|nr:30S ribosomal protein S8 [Candidatus Woesearchaeota archaeon]